MAVMQTTDAKSRTRPTRRRVLCILGAAAGLPLLAPVWARPQGAPRGSGGPLLARGVLYSESGVHHWKGVALGADSSIILHQPDPAAARRTLSACLAEVERLERIFSLQREDSELGRLNRTGRIEAPSHDLVRLLADARNFARLSQGAFDVTVQPLWRLYAAHFTAHRADPKGPGQGEIERARRLVDYRGIDVEIGRIALARPGMAVTLNGIAQGYITDRVAELLRESGVGRVLVQLGETAALEPPLPGRPWRIGLSDPMNPDRIAHTVELANQAVATSGGYGMRFDEQGRHHHLFDPATGRSSGHHLAVSVIAPRATVADALSTALYVMPAEGAERLVRNVGGVTALLTAADGRMVALGA
jgi:thiamine biosynthesis lipoprotein